MNPRQIGYYFARFHRKLVGALCFRIQREPSPRRPRVSRRTSATRIWGRSRVTWHMSTVAGNGGRGKRGWTSGWLYTGARSGWLTCQRPSPTSGPDTVGASTCLLIPARRRGLRRADVRNAVLRTPLHCALEDVLGKVGRRGCVLCTPAIIRRRYVQLRVSHGGRSHNAWILDDSMYFYSGGQIVSSKMHCGAKYST